jgi:hypothetical protein
LQFPDTLPSKAKITLATSTAMDRATKNVFLSSLYLVGEIDKNKNKNRKEIFTSNMFLLVEEVARDSTTLFSSS